MAKSRRRAIDRGSARRSRRRRATAALLLPALLAVWTPGCGVRTARSDWIRPTPAAEPEVRARWEELPPLVEGRDVEMVLRDGVYVRGRAGEVTPEALLLRVRKTSDPAVIPKGPIPIPREQVSVLTVGWRKGPARVLMPFVMVPGVAYALIGLGVGGDHLGYFWYAVHTGSAVGGYSIGKRIDAKRMRVVVVSPPPTDEAPRVGTSPEFIELEWRSEWLY